jgi:multiple sugar transport system permease protein
MTQGGPNNATLTFMLYLYKMAFQNLRMGYASAMAWLLFLYLVLLTAIIFKSSSKWVYYESSRREERQPGSEGA